MTLRKLVALLGTTLAKWLPYLAVLAPRNIGEVSVGLLPPPRRSTIVTDFSTAVDQSVHVDNVTSTAVLTS